MASFFASSAGSEAARQPLGSRLGRLLVTWQQCLAWAFAAALTALIFGLDLLTMLKGAIAVLYIIVILMVAPGRSRRAVVALGGAAMALATIAYVGRHPLDVIDNASLRFAVSLVAIMITTLLLLRDRSARMTLAEQARVLELTHDTVIIRDRLDRVVYWNDGAQALYGWSRAEALGQPCNVLLKSDYPAEEVHAALARDGRWTGEMERTQRGGHRIVLATRWLQRKTAYGADDGVIEASSDLTEQRRADAERLRSERRYSTMFHAAGFASWESDWSAVATFLRQEGLEAGQPVLRLQQQPEMVLQAAMHAVVKEVNQATVDLFGAAGREALLGGNLSGRFLPEAARGFAEILEALLAGARMVEVETRFLTFAGQTVDVMLRVTLLDDGDSWSRVLAMAVDVTERNEARAKLEQASAELAHAARVATLGQLAASIAHEVNQPLSAIITYAKSGKRWIGRAVPDIGEAAECLDHIVQNGSRAAAVIARVRGLARKAAPQAEPLDMREIVEEAIALTRREAATARVAIHREEEAALPLGFADRVQTQQVLVNLLMNGIQALRSVPDRPRELTISLGAEPGEARLTIRVADNGPGIALADPAEVFAPFFTTKEDGMGIGLSICRTIVEGQGGRIQARNRAGEGAIFEFSLPIFDEADTGNAASQEADLAAGSYRQ